MIKLSIITATHQRSDQLALNALPSILRQVDQVFEWVVVNDGADPATRELIAQSKPACALTYLEMAHPTDGFGLCHARNMGIAAASGELVSYLDDDNAITPEFVAATKQYFQHHPSVRYSMAQQQRRRDVVKHGRVQRRGTPFVSPSHDTDIAALLEQRALFDSNGFTHERDQAPTWNSNYRVFADYEYLLQCANVWGRERFQLQERVLVVYVQRSDGVIGQSSYQDWADEMQALLAHDYPVLTRQEAADLATLRQQWQDKAIQRRLLPAFAN